MKVPILPHPRSERPGKMLRVLVEARVFVPCSEGVPTPKDEALAAALVGLGGEANSFAEIMVPGGGRWMVFLEEVLRARLSPAQDVVPS